MSRSGKALRLTEDHKPNLPHVGRVGGEGRAGARTAWGSLRSLRTCIPLWHNAPHALLLMVSGFC